MRGRGELFVVSAPSGAGKSTLVARLTAALPDLVFSVSWTTRAPRPGEEDGVAYHFTDEATFHEKIAGGEMLYGFVAGLLASNYDITDLYIDGILKVLDHDINRLGVVLDEIAAAAGDSIKVTVTVSADEAALPHDVKKYL